MFPLVQVHAAAHRQHPVAASETAGSRRLVFGPAELGGIAHLGAVANPALCALCRSRSAGGLDLNDKGNVNLVDALIIGHEQ